jgi:protease YdgD
MRYRLPAATVVTIAALLFASGSVASGSGAAEPLPGVGALDRRLAVDVGLPPWNAIAKVQTNIATRCTGALVGPDIVMTAAHCLYNRRTGTLLQPESLHFLFGYERGGYFRHAQVVRYVVGDGFDGAEPARHPASDWARLELAEAVPPAIEPLRLSKEIPVPGTAVALPGYNQDRIHLLCGYFLSNYRDIDDPRPTAADSRLLGDPWHERRPGAAIIGRRSASTSP